MKRLFIVLLALLLLCSSALAGSIDLTGMSFDDLIALRGQVDLALWNSQEWKKVTVPEGIYLVGVDIPAGDWQIESILGEQSSVSYFEKMNQYGTEADKDAYYFWDRVINIPSYEVKSIHLNLVDGMYVGISLAPVVFTPYTGPSFTFE